MLRRIGFSAVLATVILASFRSSPAADVEIPLTRLIGRDVGVCVEIIGLRREWAAIHTSPVLQRLQRTEFYERWSGSDDFRKLQEAARAIEKAADQRLKHLVGDLFGEHVALAVYPATDGQPIGVLLMQTAGAAELETALSIWNRLEPCTIESREHAGHAYSCRYRTRAAEGENRPQYYVKLGRVLALSDDEEAIRRVIDLAGAGLRSGATLAESETYREAIASLAIDHFARVYLNFRAWDDEIRRQPAPDERFLAVWRQCESLVAGLNVEEGPVLESVLHFRGEGLPKTWLKSLGRLAGPPKFLQRVPRRALAAFAGRHDFGGLAAVLLAEQSELQQKQLESFRQVSRGMLLGLDLFDDVLPWLEPNWGAYLVPRSDLAAGALPVEGVLAFELPADPPPEAVDVPSRLRDGLDNGLKTALNLLAAWYNLQSPDETAVLTSESTETGTIWWLENWGVYQPAYGFTQDYLVLASSPALIREFAATGHRDNLESLPAFQRNASVWFPRASQVLFLNMAVARSYLRSRWDVLLDQATAAHAAPRDVIERRMRRVDALLSLADSVFVAAEIDRKHLRLVLGATAEAGPSAADGAGEHDPAR